MNQAQLDSQLEVDITALFDTGEADGNLGFHKKLRRAFKKVIKVVKKVAPVAAAGAAIFYGAPYAIAAAKTVGSKISGGVKAIKTAVSVAPLVAGQTSPPPAASILSPEVIQLATQLAQKKLQAQGINMQSPQAQAVLNKYVTGTARNMRAVSAPANKTDMKKFILPAVAAGAAILALKG